MTKECISPDPKRSWDRTVNHTSLEKVGHRVVSHVDGGVRERLYYILGVPGDQRPCFEAPEVQDEREEGG